MMLLLGDIGKRIECVSLQDASSKMVASISHSMIESHLLPCFEGVAPAISEDQGL